MKLFKETANLFTELRNATIKKVDELVSSGQTVETSLDFLRRKSKVGESVWKSVYKHYDVDFKDK